MKYLVDTHALLWYLNDDPQLPVLPKTCIENPANTISVSIASFWEITIKHALGKLDLQTTLEDIHAATVNQGITPPVWRRRNAGHPKAFDSPDQYA